MTNVLTELRIWIGSSSVWEPIHRKGASLVKTSDKSFSIFGGSTTFSDEVLLNDIWSFDLGMILLIWNHMVRCKESNTIYSKEVVGKHIPCKWGTQCPTCSIRCHHGICRSKNIYHGRYNLSDVYGWSHVDIWHWYCLSCLNHCSWKIPQSCKGKEKSSWWI